MYVLLAIILLLIAVCVTLLALVTRQAKELADADSIIVMQDRRLTKLTKELKEAQRRLEGGGGSKS